MHECLRLRLRLRLSLTLSLSPPECLLYGKVLQLCQLRDLPRQEAKILMGEGQSCQVLKRAYGSWEGCKACHALTFLLP